MSICTRVQSTLSSFGTSIGDCFSRVCETFSCDGRIARAAAETFKKIDETLIGFYAPMKRFYENYLAKDCYGMAIEAARVSKFYVKLVGVYIVTKATQAFFQGGEYTTDLLHPYLYGSCCVVVLIQGLSLVETYALKKEIEKWHQLAGSTRTATELQELNETAFERAFLQENPMLGVVFTIDGQAIRVINTSMTILARKIQFCCFAIIAEVGASYTSIRQGKHALEKMNTRVVVLTLTVGTTCLVKGVEYWLQSNSKQKLSDSLSELDSDFSSAEWSESESNVSLVDHGTTILTDPILSPTDNDSETAISPSRLQIIQNLYVTLDTHKVVKAKAEG